MLLQISILLAFSLHQAKGDWYHHTLAFEINADNIEAQIGQERHVILDFFTPWCIYCQYMAQDWNRVWEHYNGANSKRKDVLIAKINCGDEPNHPICHSFHVHSFPTILHFEPGSKSPINQYSGNRQFADFARWIDRICPLTDASAIDNKQENKVEEKQDDEGSDDDLPDQDNTDVGEEKQKPDTVVVDIQKEYVQDVTDEIDEVDEKSQLQELKMEITAASATLLKLKENMENQDKNIEQLEDRIKTLQNQISLGSIPEGQQYYILGAGILLGILIMLIKARFGRPKYVYEEKSV